MVLVNLGEHLKESNNTGTAISRGVKKWWEERKKKEAKFMEDGLKEIENLL